jgi:hypothetical protein
MMHSRDGCVEHTLADGALEEFEAVWAGLANSANFDQPNHARIAVGDACEPSEGPEGAVNCHFPV